MAEKRMFTQKIIDSDAFLDMPLSTQALYFHLNMRADDDGFVNNPKRIQRTIGASEDDLKLLLAKRFLIGFESGVIVIKHWRMHNTLRKDRYNPTQYKEELSLLAIKDNNAYTEKMPEIAMATTWQPPGNQMATQYSIDKYSIDKNSIVYNVETDSVESDHVPDTNVGNIHQTQSESKKNKKPKSIKHKYGEYNNVLLTDDELTKLQDEYFDWSERIERLSSYVASTGKSYKSHYATIRNWARKDAEKPKVQIKKNNFNSIPQRDYDMAAMERMLLMRDNPADDTSDPDFVAEAEKMKERLEQKYGKR